MANIFDGIVNGWENLTFDEKGFVKDTYEKLPDEVKLAFSMGKSGIDMKKLQADGSYTISCDELLAEQGHNLGIMDKDGDYNMAGMLDYVSNNFLTLSDDKRQSLIEYAAINKYLQSSLYDENGNKVSQSSEYDDVAAYFGEMSSLDDVLAFTNADEDTKIAHMEKRMEHGKELSEDFADMDVTLDAKTMLMYQTYNDMYDEMENGTLTKVRAEEYSEKLTEIEAMDEDVIAALYGNISGHEADDVSVQPLPDIVLTEPNTGRDWVDSMITIVGGSEAVDVESGVSSAVGFNVYRSTQMEFFGRKLASDDNLNEIANMYEEDLAKECDFSIMDSACEDLLSNIDNDASESGALTDEQKKKYGDSFVVMMHNLNTFSSGAKGEIIIDGDSNDSDKELAGLGKIMRRTTEPVYAMICQADAKYGILTDEQKQQLDALCPEGTTKFTEYQASYDATTQKGDIGTPEVDVYAVEHEYEAAAEEAAEEAAKEAENENNLENFSQTAEEESKPDETAETQAQTDVVDKKVGAEVTVETDNKHAQMAEEKFGDIVNKAEAQTSVDMQME